MVTATGMLRSRSETRDVPVVVLTGVDAEGEVAKAFEAGADDFVRKPFRPLELVARIRGDVIENSMVILDTHLVTRASSCTPH